VADLNATYGTVTDGGSTSGIAFLTPSAANDGNSTTAATSKNYVAVSGLPHVRRLKSDLGAARLVGGSTVQHTNLISQIASKLEYSTDGVVWSDAGATPTFDATTKVQTWAFPASITARYWRLVRDIPTGGYQSYMWVYGWTLDEGEPPPPPPSGVTADWDDDGFGDDTSADFLTPYAASWRISRGASAEVTGGAQPGAATLVLNNPADDRFNPLNTGGPLYGLLRDGVPVWIGVDADGTVTGPPVHGLFGGRIASVTPIPQGGLGRAAKVEITCEDALAWLARTPAKVADALWRSQDELRLAILTAAGEARHGLDSEIPRLPVSGWDSDALAGLEAINRANGTRHAIRPGATPGDWYSYITRNRQWRLDATVDATLDAGTDHLIGTGGWRLSADTVINRVKATVTPISFTPGTVTVWQSDTVPFTVRSGSPREIWVEFDDFVTDAVLDLNYTGTNPTRSITNYGDTAKITITSAGTSTITGLSVEGRMVRRGVDETYTADDTASQAGPRGVRAGPDITGPMVGSLATARGIAGHVVWRYGSPQYRPTLTVVNWIPEQFEIDLYDTIAVTIGELSMTDRIFEVVGLTHECDLAAVDADGNPVVSHTTTYVLQECRVQAYPGWFRLGLSLLGAASDILAY
jgi:hypothetical protein